MKRLTLKAAAQYAGVSKSKIWRAVNDGTLLASKARTSGGQEAWVVLNDHLDEWMKNHLGDSETVLEDLLEESETIEGVEVLQDDQSDSDQFSEAFHDGSESFRPIQGPPVELYLALVDKVTRSERRSVELELELRQYRLLLTENAESIVEREAKFQEAQAKQEKAEALIREREEERDRAWASAEEAKQEAARAQIELETLKTEMSKKEAAWSEARKPWYKKLFGSAV